MSSLKYLGASQLADHLIPLLSSFILLVSLLHIFRKRFIRQDPDTNPSKRLAHIQTSLVSFNCTCSISERMGMVTAIFNGRDRESGVQSWES